MASKYEAEVYRCMDPTLELADMEAKMGPDYWVYRG